MTFEEKIAFIRKYKNNPELAIEAIAQALQEHQEAIEELESE